MTEKKKQIALTVRIDAEENKRFAALLALNGETATNILRNAVNSYIKEHEHKINV